MSELTNKSVLIAGGAGDAGEQIARVFLQAGANVGVL